MLRAAINILCTSLEYQHLSNLCCTMFQATYVNGTMCSSTVVAMHRHRLRSASFAMVALTTAVVPYTSIVSRVVYFQKK